MVITKRFLLNLIFFLSFFPFLKLVPWIRAEAQPFGSVLALVFIFMFGVKRDRTAFAVLLLMLILLFSSMASAIIGYRIEYIVLDLAAYMLPLFLFLAFKDNVSLLSTRVFGAAVTIYLLVGIFQYFGLFFWIEPFLKMFIPRASGSEIGHGGRGVTFLAPEPAWSGMMLLMLMATSSFFYIAGKITRGRFYILTFAVLFMFLLNKSGNAFLLFFIFLAVCLGARFLYGTATDKARAVFFVVAIVPAVMAAGIFIMETFTGSVRYIGILNMLVDILLSGHILSFESLANISGGRFASVLMGYISILDGFGFGHGIASYSEEFLRLSEFAGIDWRSYTLLSTMFRFAEARQPSAYGAQIALDAGLLGLSVLVLLAFSCWKRGWIRRVHNMNHAALLAAMFSVAVFMIFFRSITSIPVPWVILAYVHHFQKNEVLHLPQKKGV